MNQWIDLEISDENDLKKFLSGYETNEKYYIFIAKSINFEK